MSKHLTISPVEAADRLVIRELVDAYAHWADRRDAKGQMSLFTEGLGVLCTARTRRHVLCCLTSESKRVAPAEASQLRRLTRKNYKTTSMRRGP